MRRPRIPDIRCAVRSYAALVEERDRLIHEVEALKRGLNERCTFVEGTISRSKDFRVRMESTVTALETLHEQLKTLEQTNEEELKRRETTIAELQEALKCTQLQLVESERHRKQLHNSLMDLKGNIRVFCRVRPLLTTGDGLGNESIISYPRTMESRDRGIELLADGRKNGFKFDRVFGPEASQLDIFVEISQLVQSALDGYKVCIFSYGHSGSGKTYTMLGEHESPERKGLIPRSLEQIFQTVLTLSAQGWEHTLKVSMLEIYNDEVHDLMSKRGSPRRVKHDATVAGLIELCVHSIDEVTRLLDIAARRRSVAETSKNSRSSRSHFICKLQISGMNKDTKEVVEGVLNLVDLAGSERDSEAVGERKKEAIMINLSLTWPGVLIRGVADKQEHVMVKDSKLTRLLQPYLGGDSKTLMFVNVSSELSSATESLRSLNFAARVNEGRIGDSRAQTSKRVRDSHSRHGRPAPSPLGYGRQTTMR